MPEPTIDTPQAIIEGEVTRALAQQKELEEIESALMQNDQFKKFVTLRDSVNKKWDEVRKQVETVMVAAYKEGKVDKTMKGEWGSITVVESDKFEIDEKELHPKFWKKVVDESKIRATFQLEGKAPKGTKQYKKFGIQMRLK